MIFTEVLLWVIYFISLYFVIFWLLVFLEQENVRGTKKKLNFFPKVTVTIPAYNEENTIETTIISAVNLNYPKNKLEILVVNDGSTDKTREKVLVLQKKYSNVRLIDQKNSGKGVALNKALYSCKGEYFVCLDADSVIEKNALQHLLPHFKDEKVACVLPLMKSKKAKNLLQKMQFAEYIVNIFYKKLMGFLNSIPVAPGPFSVFRKQVLIDLRGYEINNLTEDLELTLRLQKHHYKIIQDMHAEVYTSTPLTFKAFIRQRKRWYKGGFFNALKYRKMMFNPEYGDFGMMPVPLLVVSGIIGISMILTLLYNILKPNIITFLNLRHVDFDFWTFLQNMSFSFNLLDTDFTNLFIFIIMFAITLFILYSAFKYTGEKVFAQGKIHIVLFLFFYFFMLGITWLLLVPELFHKKHKW